MVYERISAPRRKTTLPLELLFHGYGRGDIEFISGGINSTTILRTCRQVYSEARVIISEKIKLEILESGAILGYSSSPHFSVDLISLVWHAILIRFEELRSLDQSGADIDLNGLPIVTISQAPVSGGGRSWEEAYHEKTILLFREAEARREGKPFMPKAPRWRDIKTDATWDATAPITPFLDKAARILYYGLIQQSPTPYTSEMDEYAFVPGHYLHFLNSTPWKHL